MTALETTVLKLLYLEPNVHNVHQIQNALRFLAITSSRNPFPDLES